jgi:hypothetical protein
LQQSDLVHEQFVPGYSSFLFNQLLQTQFYSVKHGGLSINLNLTEVSHQYNANNIHSDIPRAVIIAESTNHTPSPPTPTTKSTPLNPPPQSSAGTNENYTVNSNNSNKYKYQSSLFQHLFSQHQNEYKELFEVETKPHIPLYPEIDLLAFFGQDGLTTRNKKRLQTLLYDKDCNIGNLTHHTILLHISFTNAYNMLQTP